MPATEYQTAANVSLAFLGSILSIRRNHVVIAVDSTQEQELQDHDTFQRAVADRILCMSEKEEILSLPWLQNLLNDFIFCLEEFKALVVPPAAASRGSAYDRLLAELLDRAVKALDICNAVSSGVDLVSNWRRQAEIAISALDERPSGDGHLRRAKRALSMLVASLEETEEGGRTTERTRSFGRRSNGAAAAKERHSRSLSWNMSRNWSAAKQLQAMVANLCPPRGAEMATLAAPIYAMNTVIVFVMWALVAAIPCQERGAMAVHLPVPARQFPWAGPLAALQEKIAEEWRKKEKAGRGGAWLLPELQRLEKCSQQLLDSSSHCSENDIKSQVSELADICRRLEEGLMPLERRVREVFHRIIRNRMEVMDCLGEMVRSSAPSGL